MIIIINIFAVLVTQINEVSLMRFSDMRGRRSENYAKKIKK
jgi:hypothetical protein